MADAARDDHRTDVGRFFDNMSDDYTDVIERCFPKYREMLQVLLDYLPPEQTFHRILELGCGTGNLTLLLLDSYPRADLHVVDLSAESLELCRRRLDPRAGVTLTTADFRHLDFPPESFDLVISSIAIHHLGSEEKRNLFRNIFGWLTVGGIFTFADQCAGASPDIYDRHMQLWQARSSAAGATAEEWQMWMRHQAEHDHHDSLIDQCDWLKEASFTSVDCLWRCWLWSVIHARKECHA